MNKVYLICLCGLIFSNLGLAEDLSFKHEIFGGVDSNVGFVRFNIITANSIQYSLSGSYAYSLSRSFQFGVQFGIADSGAPIDSFRYSLYAPVTYNWGGEDLRDDFFVRLSPGLSYGYSVDFALLAQFGKRFKLLPNISWRPTVGLVGYFGNGAARSAIDIIPLVFSFVF